MSDRAGWLKAWRTAWLRNMSQRRPLLFVLAMVHVSSCAGDGDDGPTIPSVPQYSLNVSISSGVASSIGEGETLHNDGEVVAYSINAKPGFQNPLLLIDGQVSALVGDLVMTKSHTLIATADPIVALPPSDSILISSLAQAVVNASPQELSQMLDRTWDSLLATLAEDSAVSSFGRAIAYAFVPERDAGLLARALVSAAPYKAEMMPPTLDRRPASSTHTEIVYINGIATTTADLQLTWQGALRPLAERIGLTSAAGFGVSGFYNRAATAEDPAVQEFLTCVALKWNQITYGITTALLNLPGCLPDVGLLIPGVGVVDDFTEAITQVTNLVFLNGNPSFVQVDAIRLADAILQHRQQGKRILLVAHSQGNLMVGEALNYLQARSAWTSSDLRCVGWIAVAPPIAPVAPSLMAKPSSLIIRGMRTADILEILLAPSTGGVVTVTNELSDDYDSQGWFWTHILGWFGFGTGGALHSIVKSYFGMPRTEAYIGGALLAQTASLDRSCPVAPPVDSIATLAVQSNLSTSWTMDPGGFTGSGTTGSFTVAPAASGTAYTLSPARVSGHTFTVTNSDGGGNSVTVRPGEAKSFNILYSGAGSLPTVTLTASPTTVSAGQGTILSWSSTNVSSCSAAWTAGTGTSGTVAISPTATTSYAISCTGANGTANASVTVTVRTGSCPAPQLISAPIQTPTTWVSGVVGCADYLVTNKISVTSALQVTPGTAVSFKTNAALIIQGAGSLTAIGTSTAPIRFLGEQATPRSWDGIEFRSNSAANELTWVEVAYGTRGSFVPAGGVNVIQGARLKLTHTTIRGSADAGLVVEDGGTIPGFAANHFIDNNRVGLSIPAGLVHSLDLATDYATGNGKAYIDVTRGPISGNPQIWRVTSVPLRISGNNAIVTALTIVPGAYLLFNTNAGFVVQGTGSLTAVGTSAAPIRFLGEHAFPSSWDGIEFRSNSAANELTWVEVAYGTTNTFSPAGEIVVAGGASLRLTNSLLRDSAEWGLYVEPTGIITPTPLSSGGNTFSNNAGGNSNIP